MPQQKAYLVELKFADGRPIFPPFDLYATELSVGGGNGASSPPGNNGKNTGSSGKEDAPMTDAQKRMLYRLMFQAGFETEAATQELKQRLGVSNIKDTTKQEASSLIQQLLDQAKGVET
jgi:hypothetical protein